MRDVHSILWTNCEWKITERRSRRVLTQVAVDQSKDYRSKQESKFQHAFLLTNRVIGLFVANVLGVGDGVQWGRAMETLTVVSVALGLHLQCWFRTSHTHRRGNTSIGWMKPQQVSLDILPVPTICGQIGCWRRVCYVSCRTMITESHIIRRVFYCGVSSPLSTLLLLWSLPKIPEVFLQTPCAHTHTHTYVPMNVRAVKGPITEDPSCPGVYLSFYIV